MKETEEMKSLCQNFLLLPWDDRNFYCNYLAQSFYYITHSTRLLALAAAHATRHEKDFYRRMVAHMKEEDGHEVLAERDLARLGESVKDYSEFGMTRALYETQYYKISKSSTSILGYILALECLAVNTFEQLYEKTKSIYGAKSTTFIKIHADEDPGHVEKALLEVERLPIDQRDLVLQNYYQTIGIFNGMLTECVAK